MPLAFCTHCSRRFTAVRSTARFCSVRCRMASHRQQPAGLTVGSLFSGIGGLDLGFEWAGFQVLWQCERGTLERGVLATHWPGIPLSHDVRTFPRVPDDTFRRVDVIIGGFPCQDISTLARVDHGSQQGLAGSESGLWWDFFDVVRGYRPRCVVVENVRTLLTSNGGRDFGTVLRALDGIGYVGEWRVLSARSAGLPHRRERLFILAYSHIGKGRLERQWRMPKGRATPWQRLVHPRRDGSVDGATGGLDKYPTAVQRSIGRRRRMIGNAVAPPVAYIVARRVRDMLSD